MVLTHFVKSDIISTFQVNTKDTGSSFVQVALLTARINYLMVHLNKHKGDKHTKRGLIKCVNARKKFLRYIKNKNIDSYINIIERLGVRK
jgi:small subunit ribosomal protein S15